jgi:ribonucleotide reductase beta subunit family protein with ferritin-like domain
MNKELMSQYIEYVADHLLLNLVGQKLFHTENPFDWMVYIGLENKTNFFEARATEYAKVDDQSTITFDEEF